MCRLFIKPNCTVSPTVQFHKFVAVRTRQEICVSNIPSISIDARNRRDRSAIYQQFLQLEEEVNYEKLDDFFLRKNHEK